MRNRNNKEKKKESRPGPQANYVHQVEIQQIQSDGRML